MRLLSNSPSFMVPARAFTPGSGAHSRAPAGAVTTPPRAMAVITATRAGIQSNRHAVPVRATEPANGVDETAAASQKATDAGQPVGVTTGRL